MSASDVAEILTILPPIIMGWRSDVDGRGYYNRYNRGDTDSTFISRQAVNQLDPQRGLKALSVPMTKLRKFS